MWNISGKLKPITTKGNSPNHAKNHAKNHNKSHVKVSNKTPKKAHLLESNQKKQYPNRVTINLDNSNLNLVVGPKPLPPIVTSSQESVETVPVES